MKRAREETVKFHSLAQFASIFLDSSVEFLHGLLCDGAAGVSTISDGQLNKAFSSGWLPHLLEKHPDLLESPERCSKPWPML